MVIFFIRIAVLDQIFAFYTEAFSLFDSLRDEFDKENGDEDGVSWKIDGVFYFQMETRACEMEKRSQQISYFTFRWRKELERQRKDLNRCLILLLDGDKSL